MAAAAAASGDADQMRWMCDSADYSPSESARIDKRTRSDGGAAAERSSECDEPSAPCKIAI